MQRSFLITQSHTPETLRKASEPGEFEIRLRQLAWDAAEDGLFQIGPSRILVGKRLDQLSVDQAPGLRIELDEPDLLSRVRRRLDPEFVPAAVEGQVSARDAHHVAVAVNGTIRAVAPTFDGPVGHQRFQAIVPESSLLDGTNRIQVFAVGQTQGVTPEAIVEDYPGLEPDDICACTAYTHAVIANKSGPPYRSGNREFSGRSSRWVPSGEMASRPGA